MHFTQQVLSTKVFHRSQHNLTCRTRSVLSASDAANHCLLQFAPEYESNLQILRALGFTVEISRRYDQVWRVSSYPGLNGKVGTGHRSVVDWRSSVGGVPRVPQWLRFHAAKINSWEKLTLLKSWSCYRLQSIQQVLTTYLFCWIETRHTVFLATSSRYKDCSSDPSSSGPSCALEIQVRPYHWDTKYFVVANSCLTFQYRSCKCFADFFMNWIISFDKKQNKIWACFVKI